MRQMRNIQQHFSIRKLTIGAASVLIGLSFLGFGTQTVHADANDTAVQATSEKVDASASEAKNDVKTEDVKVEAPVTDDKAATDPTTNADVKEEKTTEPVAETPAAGKTEAPADATKQAETPATPATVSDKDAKTPATEGDAGKSTDVEKPAVPTDTTKAATDKDQDSVATKDQTLKVDQAKNGAVDPKTLKEEKIVPASEGVALDDTSIRTKVTDLVNNLGDSTTIDVSGWNTSGVTNMSSLFANLQNVQKITGLETWDVSNVTNMGHMFSNDPTLISISDVSNWNTAKVNYMDNMFNGDKNLTSVKGLSNLNVSNVINMSSMFAGTSSLKQTLSNWDAQKANETNMFDGSALTVAGPFNFDGAGLSSYINSKRNDSTATTLDVTGYKIDRINNLSQIFSGLPYVQRIVGLDTWDVSNVTNMGHMFNDDPALISVGDLSNWNTANVQFIDNMFNGDKNLTSVGDLSNWNVNKVQNMSSMFAGTSSLKQTLSNWNNSQANQSSMFDNSALTVKGPFEFNEDGLRSYINSKRNDSTLDVTNFNVEHVTDMDNLFQGFTNLKEITGLNTWNTSNVTNMGHMFVGDDKLTSIDLSTWDTSKVKNMDNMFNGDSALASIKGLSDWNTSNVTTMSNMFKDVGANVPLSERANLDLSGWDISKVTDTFRNDMFDNAHFKKLNLSGWQLNSDLLRQAINSLKGNSSIDVTNWNVSGVTDMSNLFNNRDGGWDSLTQLTGLNTWHTDNLENTSGMFDSSNLKDFNLSGWNLSKVNNADGMFANLKNPAVITLNDINGADALKANDFRGNKPLIVFSNNSDLAKLNKQTWTDENGQTVTGRQNTNYLTYYKKGDPSETAIAYQKMNFVFTDPGQLRMMVLAMLPTGDADASNSTVLDDYLKEVTSVANVKKALGDLGNKWNYEKDVQDGHLPYDATKSPLDLIIGEYGLTFTATAHIHYIDVTGKTGTLTPTSGTEITSQTKENYDTINTQRDDLLNAWDYQSNGWQLNSTSLPEEVPGTDGDYYVYLVAPDQTKTIKENIHYVIGNNPVDSTVAGNPSDVSKDITFTKKETGFDHNTLKPIYGDWQVTIDPITAPATVKDSAGNIYDIDTKHAQANRPEISIDDSGKITINIDPNSVVDKDEFDLTVPYVKRSQPSPDEPTNPVTPPDDPTQPTQPTNPTQPTTPAQPVTPVRPEAEKPAKPGKKQENGKKHANAKKSTSKRNAPVHGETVNGKSKAKKNTNSNVRPHAEVKPTTRNAAPKAQVMPAGQHVNSKGQILNAKGQVVGHVDKNAQAVLPQTGEKTTPLAWLGLGLASLAAIFGLAGDRKRR